MVLVKEFNLSYPKIGICSHYYGSLSMVTEFKSRNKNPGTCVHADIRATSITRAEEKPRGSRRGFEPSGLL